MCVCGLRDACVMCECGGCVCGVMHVCGVTREKDLLKDYYLLSVNLLVYSFFH